MRDIVFLVADQAMQQMLHGFFGREQFHRSLGCRSFVFDPRRDIVRSVSSDSFVYRNAREMLSFHARTHQRAVVLVDAKWGGSPGTDKMREHISRSLSVEWEHRHKVIVFEPELEAWLWQDNPNVGKAIGCPDFRKILAEAGFWPWGQSKPTKPKKALEYLKEHHGADGSRAAFKRVAKSVSVRNCKDQEFQVLRDKLCDWFGEDQL